MPQGHYGEYSGNHPRFSKKDDHAHTRVTDHNLHSTEKDDEAHIDYLKQDINWDNKHGHSDENMTADEKHITYLAEDEKYDEKHHSMAKNLGSPAKQSFHAIKSTYTSPGHVSEDYHNKIPQAIMGTAQGLFKVAAAKHSQGKSLGRQEEIDKMFKMGKNNETE